MWLVRGLCGCEAGRYLLALKAVSDPMLMRDSRTVIRQVKVTELAGLSSFLSTLPIQLLKGRPWSRAKAQVWREVDKL